MIAELEANVKLGKGMTEVHPGKLEVTRPTVMLESSGFSVTTQLKLRVEVIGLQAKPLTT